MHKKAPSALSRAYIYFPRGATVDSIEKVHGASHLLEHMLFKGKSGNFRKFNEKIDDLGCELNAMTFHDGIVLYFAGINKNFGKGLDLYLDFVMNPGFEDEDLENEKNAVVQEIRNFQSDNSSLFYMESWRESFFSGSYHKDPAYGYEKDVLNLTSKQLRSMFGKWFFDKKETIFLYHGNSPQRISKKVDKFFSQFPQRAIPDYSSKLLKKSSPQSIDYDYGLKGQLLLALGYHLDVDTKKRDGGFKEYVLLDMLSAFLTNGCASLLFRELREEKGLVYSVESEIENTSGDTFLIISTELAAKQEKEFFKVIDECLGNLDKEINEESFKRTKTRLQTVYARSNESYYNYSMDSIAYYSYFKIDEVHKNLEEQLNNISLKDFKQYALKLFGENEQTICSMR
jgi:predicted Zn-dependent peptidase